MSAGMGKLGMKWRWHDGGGYMHDDESKDYEWWDICMGRRIGIMGDKVGVRKWKRGVEREKVATFMGIVKSE